ncbi:MAG: hypothetical protein NTU61_04705 [Candidatus Altiarchaeota archaeon]|nr:hypothetical protein [Candidatus Altiarchaeota archaeon]
MASSSPRKKTRDSHTPTHKGKPHKKENGFPYGVAAAVLLILAISVAFYFMDSNPAPSIEQPTLTTTTYMPPSSTTTIKRGRLVPYEKIEYCLNMSLNDRMPCLRSLGLNPIEECEWDNNSQYRSLCYDYYSMKQGCPGLCELQPGLTRVPCYLGCAVNHIIPDYCGYAISESSRLSCISYVAAESHNKSLCDSIPDSGLFKDPSVYNRDYLVYRNLCYVGLAVTVNLTQKDTSSCSIVSDSDMRVYCTALVLNDTSLCRTIGDELRRNKCLRDLPKVEVTRSRNNPFFPSRLDRPYYMVLSPVIIPRPAEDHPLEEGNFSYFRLW